MKIETDKPRIISDDQRSTLRFTLFRDLLNITWRMTIPTVLAIALGMYFDRILGTHPTLFLIGAVLGFISGLYLAMRLLQKVKEAK